MNAYAQISKIIPKSQYISLSFELNIPNGKVVLKIWKFYIISILRKWHSDEKSDMRKQLLLRNSKIPQ